MDSLTKPALVSQGPHNKVPRTAWLKQQKLFSHGSGAWKAPAGLVSPEAPLLGLADGFLSLHTCP